MTYQIERSYFLEPISCDMTELNSPIQKVNSPRQDTHQVHFIWQVQGAGAEMMDIASCCGMIDGETAGFMEVVDETKMAEINANLQNVMKENVNMD